MWNENYKADTDFVVVVARRLLTPIGIWPRYGNDSAFARFRTYLHVGLIFTLMLFLLVPHLTYTFFDAEDLKKLMKVIAAQVFSSLGVIKFWTLIINKQDIRFCLEEMERNYRDVESEEDRAIMVKNGKTGRMFTFMYLSLSFGGALPYHIIMPLVAPRIPKSTGNETMIPLPYPCDYFFFIPEDPPLYQFVFVLQIFISSFILSVNCGVYSMIASMVMHCCSLFDVVAKQMEDLVKEDQKSLVPKLKKVIKFHMQAIEYSEKIEKALNLVFLCEMLGSTVILCFLEFGIIIDWDENNMLGTGTYMVLMTSIYVNVFILSFVGDRLKEESLRVGESAYNLDWSSYPKPITMTLMYIISRTQKPCVLTAAKMFDISLQGFTEVVKTSAAYLNFLRALEL